MKRVFWFLMVLSALVTAPALCWSGAVEHECSCAPGVSECSHESACADDPCGWFASAGGRSTPQPGGPIAASTPSFHGPQAVSRPRAVPGPRRVRVDLHRRGVEHSTTVLVV